MSEQVIDIEQLQQDDNNFNHGTEEGQRLMEKSFTELGAGRSILIDKNDRIIAGNKSQLAAIKAGITKVRIIETTGDELVAVKRTDVDLDSKEGREMALLDNATVKVNLEIDEEAVKMTASELGMDISVYGFDDGITVPELEDKTEAEEEHQYKVVINCVSEEEQERFYNELKDEYKCRVLTL